MNKNINLKEIRKFMEYHQVEGISAADIEYALHTNPEVAEKAYEFINKISDKKDDETLLRKRIEECNKPEELVNYMRKPMNFSIRELLRTKLLQNEALVLPLIKEKCLRNSFDIFIENAVNFFIRSETNCSEWIMENYSQFRSEYLKSLICLALGFRGEVDLIHFLIEQAERYEFEYPEENFERGPALAVEELYYRFIK